MKLCEECGQVVWENDPFQTHTCPPWWLVWVPGNYETIKEASRVRALNEELAAMGYFEEHDAEDEYPVASGGEVVTVCVAREDTPETIYRFTVRGEFTATYYVEEVDG